MVAKSVHARAASLGENPGEPLGRKDLKRDANKPGRLGNLRDSEVIGTHDTPALTTSAVKFHRPPTFSRMP
jgi:hypothetical protein